MKKFLSFAIAAFVMCSMIACNGCKSGDTSVKVEPTTDFNELLVQMNKFATEKYPGYVFYEASARFSKVDSLAENGEIDPSTMLVTYGYAYGKSTTLQLYLDSAFNVKFETIDEPWLEDMFTTPFVSLDLKYAVQLLKDAKVLKPAPGMPLVLRHQLYYKEPEPRYFVGSITGCHTVNVYTGEIDQPLAQPTQEWIDANKAMLKPEVADSLLATQICEE